NTRETYGLIAQILHWATAALILVLLPLGVFMHDLPANAADEVIYKSWFYSLHKTLGVTVFLVAFARVLWTAFQPHPRSLNGHRKFENLAAHTVHWMLYGAIILMPLTGWLHHSASEGFAPIWWPLFQDLPVVPKNPQLAMFFGTAHFFTAILLGVAVFLHVAGALKHALVDRDATLQRMIPGRSNVVSSELSEPHFKRLPKFLAIFSFFVLGGAVVAGYTMNQSGNQSGNQLGAALNQPTASAVDQAAMGWVVDKEKSLLSIQIIQMGNPVAGQFNNWKAAIKFDPENLKNASVQVEVDVASISLGGVSEQAKGSEFLNVAEHPIAHLVSESFTSTAAGTYQMLGRLSLAGRDQPVELPFTLKIENNRAFVEAEVELQRLAFGIGEKGFSGDGQLGFGVLVKVILEAEKAPSS
ncbi:MAG: cytochrome b/b6 domain-containing protein, partial [Aestuariivirgaceae bacterium]